MSLYSKHVSFENVKIVRDIPVKDKLNGGILYYEEKPITVKEDTCSGDEIELSMCFRCGMLINRHHKDVHKEFHQELDAIASKVERL